MSWRLSSSVETIRRLTPAVLGSTVFPIAGLCAAHARTSTTRLCWPRARPSAPAGRRRARSTRCCSPSSSLVVWQQFNDARGFVEKEVRATGPPTFARSRLVADWGVTGAMLPSG